MVAPCRRLTNPRARSRPARHSGGVSECPICDRGEPLNVITELDGVWVTAAEMAPLPGYVCVVAKWHAEEPYELPREQHLRFWEEALHVAEAVAAAIRPKKMNYEIHGNTIPHLHMHLFPRFDGDPFEGRPIDPAQRNFTRTTAERQALARAINDIHRS